MLPRVEGWHPEDLKAALRKLGWTQQRVANELNLCRHTVSATLQRGQSKRVCDFIAELLGVQPQDIWPSRYRVVRHLARKA